MNRYTMADLDVLPVFRFFFVTETADKVDASSVKSSIDQYSVTDCDVEEFISPDSYHRESLTENVTELSTFLKFLSVNRPSSDSRLSANAISKECLSKAIKACDTFIDIVEGRNVKVLYRLREEPAFTDRFCTRNYPSNFDVFAFTFPFPPGMQSCIQYISSLDTDRCL